MRKGLWNQVNVAVVTLIGKYVSGDVYLECAVLVVETVAVNTPLIREVFPAVQLAKEADWGVRVETVTR